jgi:hypothetical protein
LPKEPHVRRFPLLALVIATLVAPAVRAQPPSEQATALVKKGNDMRSAGDDLGALPLFVEAYRISPGPRTAAQLGLAEFNLGRWADADMHLAESLKAMGKDPWITRHAKTLEQALAQVKRQVGRVELTGDPEGAEVLINGKVVGKLPLPQPVRVSAGSVDLELRAPGYKRGFRTITLTGGQYQVVVMRLEPEGTPAAAASSPAPGGGADVTASEAAPRDQRWRPWATWGALGGALVGAGVGYYSLEKHDSDVVSFNKLGCKEMGGSASSATNPNDNKRCAQLRADYKNARTLAIVSFSAAGALAVTSLVLYLTTPEREARHARAACAPALAGEQRGLTCAFTF